VKYWEIITGNLSKAGWNPGYVSALDSAGEQSGLRTRMAMHSISGKGTGDSPVRGEFIVVRLSPLSEIVLVLVGT
jgi:hypothetical protein